MSDNKKINSADKFIKTRIGQHDFHKRSCFKYCKINEEYCPFNRKNFSNANQSLTLTRWTDVADAKLEKELEKEIGFKANQVNLLKDIGLKFQKQKPADSSSPEDEEPIEDESSSSEDESLTEEQKQKQHASDLKSAGYTCWCDGSGFQYDKMSENTIGATRFSESVYDITGYGVKHDPLKLSEWNAWIDKIQVDYRFGQVSDKNAECILFPNADNPWMFTEYVFKGVGANSSVCHLNIPQEYIIEPPLYDPMTLELVNGDFNIKENTVDHFIQEKYQNEDYVIADGYKKHKQFRQIENWDKLTTFTQQDLRTYYKQYGSSSGKGLQESDIKTKLQKLNAYADVVSNSTCPDAGLKLYRAKIPVQSVKWGEHGNIPPNSLDMTAPASWFDPKNSVVKIKAVYNAHVGAAFKVEEQHYGLVWWTGIHDTRYYENQAIIIDFSMIEFGEKDKNGEIAYKTKENLPGREELKHNNKIQGCYMVKMPTYSPKTEDENGDRMLDPANRILQPAERLIGVDSSEDQFYHMGCEYCKSRRTDSPQGSLKGVLYCKNAVNPNLDEETRQYYKDKFSSLCWKKIDSSSSSASQKDCIYRLNKTQQPVLATYQKDINRIGDTTLTNYKMNAMMLLTASMGGITGLLTGLSMMKFSADDFSFGDKDNYQVTYTVSYEPVLCNPTGVELTEGSTKGQEFEKDVQTIPGTGMSAFDSQHAIGGGDTNLLGDINHLSFHRFFTSVMHCADQKYCNNILGHDQTGGFDLISKAGGAGKCKYYNQGRELNDAMGCPYNCAPKRAIEFANVASNAYEILVSFKEAYEELTKVGVWNNLEDYHVYLKNQQKIDHEFIERDGLKWLKYEKWMLLQPNEQVAILAVDLKSFYGLENQKTIDDVVPFSSFFGGLSLFKDKNIPNEYYALCEFKTSHSQSTVRLPYNWDFENGKIDYTLTPDELPKGKDEEDYLVTIDIYTVVDMFYWYQPLNNDGQPIKLQEPKIKFNLDSFKPPKEDDEDDSSSDDTDDTYDDNDSSSSDDDNGDDNGDSDGDDTDDTDDDDDNDDGSSEQKKERKEATYLIQHVDKNGLWLCKANIEGVQVPTANSVIIDNEEKFIGGYHPQYKDYGAIGSEFMQDIVNDVAEEGESGFGDNAAAGDGAGRIIPPVSKQGYWIDSTGQYILDQREIGFDKRILGNRTERQSPKSSGLTCISFKKSNTSLDMSTGKRTPIKIINGAVFSNDSYQTIQDLRAVQRDKQTNEIKPGIGGVWIPDPESSKDYHAPVCVADEYLLPTMRKAIYCSNCDYYLAYKYSGVETCPWCGAKYEIITGNNGSQLNPDGNAWGVSWEDELPLASVIKKFFKIYAMGNADVWGPPGMAVKTDAYFWRRPVQVSNALKQQIRHRLTENFKKISAATQLTLGYPEGIGKFETIKNKEDQRLKKVYDQKSSTTDVMLFNKTMPYHMIPGLYNEGIETSNTKEDEGIIAPYSKASNDALKFISYEEIITLRNTIQPIYAYTSDEENHSQFPTLRASYNLRETVDQPIVYQGRRCKTPPIVLAYTDGKADSYQEYNSKDMSYGRLREYFPSGYTWWFMHQVMGGRSTSLSGGTYHMDDKPTGIQKYGFMSGRNGGIYTQGKYTVSKCALFIHGILPLDKIILKAYLVFGPAGISTDKMPIGRPWEGGPMMYHHYHGNAAKVNDKYPRTHPSIEGEVGEPHYLDGKYKHLHGNAGFGGVEYFDELGRYIEYPGRPPADYKYGDELAYSTWGQEKHTVIDDRFIYYKDNFEQMIGNLHGLYDVAFYRKVGTKKVHINENEKSQQKQMGYNLQSFIALKQVFGNDYGNEESSDMEENNELDQSQKIRLMEKFEEKGYFKLFNFNFGIEKMDKIFQYIVLDQEENIIVKFPPAQVWKSGSTKAIQKTLENNTFNYIFSASDGTEQNKTEVNFQLMNNEIMNNLIPEQGQGITGYFDYSWANARGYVNENFEVDYGNTGLEWNAPVIFQNDSSKPNYSGKTNIPGDEIGNSKTFYAQRCFDITKTFDTIYNDRVEREFTCFGGNTYEDIQNALYPKIFTQDHKFTNDVPEDLRDDLLNWNKKETRKTDINNMLLNDGISYPKLETLTEIPAVIADEKYDLVPSSYILEIKFNALFEDFSGKKYYYAIRKLEGEIKINEKGEEVLTQDYKILSIEIPEKIEKNSNIDSIVMTELKKIPYIKSVKKLLGLYKYQLQFNREVWIRPVDFKTDIKVPENQQPPHDFFYELCGLQVKDEGKTIISSKRNRYVQVTSYTKHPSTNEKESWQFISTKPDSQSIVIDLLRAPLLKQFRNWRYTKPYIDYSGEKCINTNCPGNYLGPSLAANNEGKYYNPELDECPSCGAKFKGTGNKIKGDGILTYNYFHPFEPDPFISEITFENNFDQEITFLYKKHLGDSWNYLASFDYSGSTAIHKSHEYLVEKTIEYLAEKTIIYKIIIKNSNETNDKNSHPNLRARFIKIQSKPKKSIGKIIGVQIKAASHYQATVVFDFKKTPKIEINETNSILISDIYQDLSFRGSTLKIIDGIDDEYAGNNNFKKTVKIISSNVFVNSEQVIYRLTFSDPIPLGDELVANIEMPVYRGGISNVKIYGQHYRTKKQSSFGDLSKIKEANGQTDEEKLKEKMNRYLTITDDFDVCNIFLGKKTNRRSDGSFDYVCTLPTIPVEILHVGVGKNNNEYFSLDVKVASNKDSANLKEFKAKLGKDGYTLIEGSCVYDYETRSIYISSKALLKDNSNDDSDDDSNDEEESSSSKELHYITNIFNQKCTNLPSEIYVSFWGGNGKSLTFPATAIADGPSYMIEKNSLTKLVESSNLKELFEPMKGSTFLPNPSNNGASAYKWIVFNNKPASLDLQYMSKSYSAQNNPYQTNYKTAEFRLPSFLSNELNIKEDAEKDKSFKEMFLNKKGEISLKGRCNTEVTLTGRPNFIISGSFNVKTGNKDDGGIRQGIIICSCVPEVSDKGRVTTAFSLPKLYVFARDKWSANEKSKK